jgi:tetratricopeptide (TPR) repeat protein
MMRRDSRSREDERIEARLHTQLGMIYGTRGAYMEARHHFGSALAAQEAIDDLGGMSKSHNNIGFLWQLQGEYERAIDNYALADQLAGKINLRYMLIFAAVNTAFALYYLGRYEEAERHCREALEICHSINDRRNLAQVEEILGLIAYCRGQYNEALGHYAVTRGIHAAAGSLYPEANTLIYEAAVQTALGRPDDAAALARRSLARAEELQAPQLKLEALNALAESALYQGDRATAQVHAAAARELADQLGSKFDRGVAERLLGESVEDEAYIQGSLALFEEIKQRFELARSRAAYGRLLLRRGNFSSAEPYLLQAQETFIAIGARGELERLAPYLERSVNHVAGSRTADPWPGRH